MPQVPQGTFAHGGHGANPPQQPVLLTIPKKRVRQEEVSTFVDPVTGPSASPSSTQVAATVASPTTTAPSSSKPKGKKRKKEKKRKKKSKADPTARRPESPTVTYFLCFKFFLSFI